MNIEEIMPDLRNGKLFRREVWGSYPEYIRYWNEAKIFVLFDKDDQIQHNSPMEYILGQDDFIPYEKCNGQKSKLSS